MKVIILLNSLNQLLHQRCPLLLDTIFGYRLRRRYDSLKSWWWWWKFYWKMSCNLASWLLSYETPTKLNLGIAEANLPWFLSVSPPWYRPTFNNINNILQCVLECMNYLYTLTHVLIIIIKTHTEDNVNHHSLFEHFFNAGCYL